MKVPALLVASLCVPSLPLCRAMRKQASAMVPPHRHATSVSQSISKALGPDGLMHTYTRETQSLLDGAGAAAHTSSVVKECQDGICTEQHVMDGHRVAHNPPGDNWLPEFHAGPKLDAVVEAAAHVSFGLDELDTLDIFSGLGPWIDGDPFFSSMATSLTSAAPSAPEESVTRHVQVFEEDGKEIRQEMIVRCSNGMCTMEYVDVDDDEDEQHNNKAATGLNGHEQQHAAVAETSPAGGVKHPGDAVGAETTNSAAFGGVRWSKTPEVLDLGTSPPRRGSGAGHPGAARGARKEAAPLHGGIVGLGAPAVAAPKRSGIGKVRP